MPFAKRYLLFYFRSTKKKTEKARQTIKVSLWLARWLPYREVDQKISFSQPYLRYSLGRECFAVKLLMYAWEWKSSRGSRTKNFNNRILRLGSIKNFGESFPHVYASSTNDFPTLHDPNLELCTYTEILFRKYPRKLVNGWVSVMKKRSVFFRQQFLGPIHLTTPAGCFYEKNTFSG